MRRSAPCLSSCRAVSRGGGAVVVLAEGGGSPADSLSAAGEFVCWTTQAGQILAVPKQGGPVVVLATEEHGTFWRIPQSGARPQRSCRQGWFPGA